MQLSSYATPIALLAATVTGQADDLVLDPTVVTDSRLEEVEDEVAVLDSKEVTSEDLEKAQAATLEDVFQETPSVTVNGGRTQAQQIFVNGLESTLSNVTVDGATQGNIYHHSSGVFVEPELLKQVSIDPGAGNALQGLGALNGAVEFETINAFDFLSDGREYGGLTKGTYYVNGEGYRFSQTIASRLSSNWGILVSGGYLDRDDYQAGDGETVDLTDYTSQNALVKLSGRFDNGQSLDIGFEHVESETLAYNRINVDGQWLIDSGRPTGELQPTVLGRSTATLKYALNPVDNKLLNLQANAYFSRQSYERETTDEYSALDTMGITVRNASRLFEAFTATYGVDVRYTRNNLDLSWLGEGEEEETAYGFFLQNDYTPHHMITFSLGGRYDFYDYESVSGEEFDSSQFSPNASITLRPLDGLSLTGSWARAYRGVGIRESFLPSISISDSLDGEESETFKIAADFEKNGFFASASYFNQSIDNYLYPITSNGSLGDIKNEGYDAFIGYRANGFSTSLGVADNDPEVDGYAYPDDFGMVVAGRRWIFTTSYAHEDSGVTVGGSVEYREEVDEVPLGSFPAVAGKDSYTLVNGFVRWDVPQVEGLSLSANVDNIFDQDYQAHTIYTASGLKSPGREYRFGAAYEF
ncbi:MAG: TonB-dependent receptor [Verrucomicrobiota bacterium JB023]|nr:TonB-dependent receptor [Verrucomicrobiota bacterium JB023]